MKPLPTLVRGLTQRGMAMTHFCSVLSAEASDAGPVPPYVKIT